MMANTARPSVEHDAVLEYQCIPSGRMFPRTRSFWVWKGDDGSTTNAEGIIDSIVVEAKERLDENELSHGDVVARIWTDVDIDVDAVEYIEWVDGPER